MSLVFSNTTYPLTALVSMIETGQLGLPDLQRPFVWDRTKVRDLFDSLYRGYPAGHFLFWSTAADHGTHQIGQSSSRPAPQKLIVDGQQRLTSIYSVLRAQPVVADDFSSSRIRIAFRPGTAEFEVANASTDNDPEWLSDISEVWNSHHGTYLFITAFIQRLKDTRFVGPDEEKHIAAALSRLEAIQAYQFTALELSVDLEVEQVAEVFVRTNSKGVPLNQADFILTLMSVHWEEGRVKLEQFSRASKQPSATGTSPFNHFLNPSPDQLLRVAVGLTFRRAQLRAVYQLLRGKDIESGQVSVEARLVQFQRLSDATEKVLDLGNWKEFLKTLLRAGYRSGSMITSDNNILYAYLAFLIGRHDFGIPLQKLRDIIARWFFMTALKGRYTGNFESQAERDLRRFAQARSGQEYIDLLEQAIETELTSDYWRVNLPDALDTSSAYSPALFAYYAALNLLDAKVLFSSLTVKELLDPTMKGKRSAVERHHLFPRGYLKSLGVIGISRTNQIANYAFVEWPENLIISDRKPAEYFPELWEQVPTSAQPRMRFMHALPEDWENLDYADFLAQRRKLMAQVVKAGYERLKTGIGPFDDETADPTSVVPPSVADLLEVMETEHVEFKASARHSIKPEIPERVINEGVIKTVAAFLNADGGTLGIGISDDGEILGIQHDLNLKNQDLDSYQNWLTTLFETSLGSAAATNAKIRFEEVDGAAVCLVDVKPSMIPVFASTQKGAHVFYVRNNNSTRILEGPELLAYEKARWPTSAST